MGWGPKAPDMTAANIAAATGAEISKEQWRYYQDEIAPRSLQQMDDSIQIGRDTYNAAKEAQDFQMGLTRKYDDRFWNTQVPLEDSMIRGANSFDTGEWAATQKGLGRSTQAQAFARAEAEADRNMSRRGVNPSDGAAMAMRRDMAINKALAQTQAEAQVNLAADQLGWARKGEVAALSRGLPGFTSAASSAAMNWGNAGINANASGMQGITAASAMNTSSGNGAAQGLQSASQNMRLNAIEEAKNPGFDALMGIAAGGMKLAGATYTGKGWG